MRPRPRSASVSATSTETRFPAMGPSRTTAAPPWLSRALPPHPAAQTTARRITSRLGEKPAFQPKKELLALEAAGIADQAPARPDDAMARDDDRDGIAVERAADRPGGTRLADAGGEPAVRVHLPVRNAPQLGQHELLEGGQPTQVDGKVEVLPSAFEVLVELALHVVHRARRAQHARAVEPGQPLDLGFGIGVEGDLADAPLGRGDEQRPDGGVGHVVGDVQERVGGGALAEGAVGLDGKRHIILLRSRRTPEDAAWRAASSLEPSAAAMSAYSRS